MKYINHGEVKNGKFLADDPEYLKKSFASLEGKRVTVTTCRFRKPRSDKENNYYWGVVVLMIANEIGEMGEAGQSYVHETLKSQFLTEIRWKVVKDKRIKFTRVKSTTELSTIEMEEYLEWVRIWAAQFLNISIPLPNEIEL